MNSDEPTTHLGLLMIFAYTNTGIPMTKAAKTPQKMPLSETESEYSVNTVGTITHAAIVKGGAKLDQCGGVKVDQRRG